MNSKRPYVLSIAGYDPTGGAGVLADVKTSERLHCYGMTVLTANTVQTDESVKSVKWFTTVEIVEQIEALKKFEFKAVKIGIVQNQEMLLAILSKIHAIWSDLFVVWDPVLKASDGSSFFDSGDVGIYKEILDKVDLITPNTNEIETLSKMNKKGIEGLKQHVDVLLTGGHRVDQAGVDEYFSSEKKLKYNPQRGGTYFNKHGSGCVFSTALACYKALGYSTHKSILKGKRYIERILKSNPSLLAYHY